jgi:hydrogenase maturation protease
MEKAILVVGIGNPLMSDEGVGVRIIERFQSEKDKFPDVEFVDAGTEGVAVLHLIANRKKVVFIDCALMGTMPGTIKKFFPDEVESVKKISNQSLHEADILKVVEMSKQLGESPGEIIFFGIEPQTVQQGNILSGNIEKRFEEYIEIISREF